MAEPAPPTGATSGQPASFAHPDYPGLQITDLKVGTGPEVKPGDTIEVNYVGTLEDGTVFDQTQSGPVSFPIGKGMLIKGWDAGVPGMRVGGVRRLFVPASLGYGAKGAPPKVPPYAALIFEIELLAIK